MHLLFEVCITDIMETSGQRIEQELSQRFSRDDVMFVKCDVTSKDQMQGWQTEHHTYVIYKIIISFFPNTYCTNGALENKVFFTIIMDFVSEKVDHDGDEFSALLGAIVVARASVVSFRQFFKYHN